MTPLLERERELEALRIALSKALQGSGQIVLVEGAAGIGKTSLLRSAAAEAGEAGFICFRARASELERDFAFGCVRQLLEPTVTRASEQSRALLFEGAAALSRPLFEPGVLPHPATAADRSFSMLHGLYWLLNNVVAEGPVVLSIDDLQWSDTDSLHFLNYLAPRLDGIPLAVLASARSGEGMPAELARLSAVPETTVLRPQPLSIDAASLLCERMLEARVSPAFAAACRDSTGGNPFLLEALLHEWKERDPGTDVAAAERVRGVGPVAVARAVLLRLSGAPSETVAVVYACAVLGDGASLSEVARMADLSEEAAARAADLLISRAILKRGDGLEFAHPIVREAVFADIGANERARAHARAVEILTAGGASEERVAAQIVEAEPVGAPERVRLLRRVAAGAFARGAPAAAVAWLRRALAEPPPSDLRAEVLLELGSAELRLALPEAVDHLVAAVQRIREPVLLTIAARQLANAFSMLGDADRAVSSLASAIAVVEPEDRERALILEAELAAKSQQATLESRAAAASRLERHVGLKGVTPGERLVLASLAFQRAKASESAGEAIRHIERALADACLLDAQEPDVVGPFYALVIGLLDSDALHLADTWLERALTAASARASIPASAFLIAHRGWFSLRRGSVSQAETDARTALELLEAHDIRLGARFALALLIAALIETDDLAAAESALGDSGLAADIPPGLANNQLLEARGLLRLAQGRPHDGLPDLLEFGRRDQLWGGANPLASRWRAHASVALAALGDAPAARRMASDDLERARRWGAASGIGIAQRALALVEGGASAVEGLSAAVAALQRSPARLEHARALADLGAALRRGNQRADARRVLHDALHRAEACGATAVATRARTELRAAGGRSRRPTPGSAPQLTVSERRVAELAAAGRSNPEIAQALFVTRKTIETHLGNVYRKLDIAGRWEVGRALAGHHPAIPD